MRRPSCYFVILGSRRSRAASHRVNLVESHLGREATPPHGAELERKRDGKKTETGMSENALEKRASRKKS